MLLSGIPIVEYRIRVSTLKTDYSVKFLCIAISYNRALSYLQCSIVFSNEIFLNFCILTLCSKYLTHEKAIKHIAI